MAVGDPKLPRMEWTTHNAVYHFTYPQRTPAMRTNIVHGVEFVFVPEKRELIAACFHLDAGVFF
jgi:hypothetical protein